jgi:dTDP-4-dehydrorhamnose reductase
LQDYKKEFNINFHILQKTGGIIMKTKLEILEFMTRPSERLIRDMRALNSDIMILGAGGKIGPSLAITAKRAFDAAGIKKKVIAVSLYDYKDAPDSMREAGVEVIEADISDPEKLQKLPEVKNIIYMVGRKFGTSENQSQTWQVNVLLPAKVCERFPSSNIVAFSTGNVYGMTGLNSGGSNEFDEVKPDGEYAQSCLGRERMMEYYSEKDDTRMLLFRLNYAIDMRYGVLYDIAKAVYNETPVSLGQPVFNCIWQGDVCEYALRSLLHTSVPPVKLNVTGPETISTRWVAMEFAKRFHKSALFSCEEGTRALLSNAGKMSKLMGYPAISLEVMIDMVAEWILAGGEAINAPTHFETTDGKY